MALSRFGRVLRAARANEIRVATLGYDVVRILQTGRVVWTGTPSGLAANPAVVDRTLHI